MAKINSIQRKRYYASARAKFYRKKQNEEKKIHKEISNLTNKTYVTCNDENQSENENTTAEQTNTIFHDELRNWAIQYNVRTYCLRDLLKILNNNGVPFLPRDPATFLHTPKSIEIENIADGQFWYSGIANKLSKIFQTADKSMRIELNIHVDGLQLFNSSSKQFWPILGQIHGTWVFFIHNEMK